MSDATETRKDRLRHLANEVFPAAARAGRYPIVFNHCFLRVVYDNLLGARWQDVLARGKPAIHQLTDEQLDQAIALGEKLVSDRDTCVRLNRRSLAWRGKRGGKE